MNPTAELMEEAVSGLGEGREERQQGPELPELETWSPSHHLSVPCHMYQHMVSWQVWWVRLTPETGALLCVIGSVCGFTLSDEV